MAPIPLFYASFVGGCGTLTLVPPFPLLWQGGVLPRDEPQQQTSNRKRTTPTQSKSPRPRERAESGGERKQKKKEQKEANQPNKKRESRFLWYGRRRPTRRPWSVERDIPTFLLPHFLPPFGRVSA
eukprot:TRINITY_DN4663_c0_g2_i1.p3 TRINITY_DN4663_c0_g2~~TRINITY_DN4663_c0_g2_i1.p3  ORF type:complete len:126 (-),score=8.17 TRINITY_DN4663_c0_g2_i1:34-411(-)